MIIKQKEPNMTNYIITQQDKELVLRYLSMALPSGVKCKHFDDSYAYTLLGIDGDVLHIDCPVYDEGDGYYEVDYCKPYLRPMSSMTEEEDKKRIQLGIWRSSQTNGYEVTRINPEGISESYDSQAFQKALVFLLKNHFDIFGLIPKGLAIAVTEENNPYENK